jgi:hypothetical protein
VGVNALKKVALMLAMVIFFIVGNASASDFIETGKEVEVKDQAAKMYIYESLETWMTHDVSDFYHKKYKAESIQWDGPNPEKIRIWIKEVKPGSGDRPYTHVIRVFLPFEKVIINDKKGIKSADTFIYAVNAGMLSLCPESGKSEKEIKLINSYHKVRP